MSRLLLAAGLILSMASASYAADAPKVPPSAKKLTGAEIMAQYAGTYSFKNYTRKDVATGSVTYDFAKKTCSGNWAVGGQTGTFTGTIRVKGDKYCYKNKGSKELCETVFLDGNQVYEVNAKGQVDSVNTKM